MEDSKIESYFFEACRKGDLAIAEQLYGQNPDLIHIEDSRHFTPLIIAVYNNHPHVVDFLLQKGANTEGQDFSGNTALMGACFKGYKEIVVKLIEAGATINQRNGQGAPALTFAATFGHLEIAALLLEKGADSNLRDVRGKSPLDHAIIQENEPMAQLIHRHVIAGQ